ncbi:hypothetical protein CR513_61207, partial [Mucuna pruriens]
MVMLYSAHPCKPIREAHFAQYKREKPQSIRYHLEFHNGIFSLKRIPKHIYNLKELYMGILFGYIMSS